MLAAGHSWCRARSAWTFIALAMFLVACGRKEIALERTRDAVAPADAKKRDTDAGDPLRPDEAKGAFPPPSVADLERRQKIACDLTLARREAAGLDKMGLHSTAVHHLEALQAQCGSRFSKEDGALIANDLALIYFHADDDKACLAALDAIPSPGADGAASASSEATTFNRALCGKACTLSPKVCRSALSARNKALAARKVRKSRSQKVRSLCADSLRIERVVDLGVLEQGRRALVLDPAGPPAIAAPIAAVLDMNRDGIADLLLGEPPRNLEKCRVWEHMSPEQADEADTGSWALYWGCGNGRYVLQGPGGGCSMKVLSGKGGLPLVCLESPEDDSEGLFDCLEYESSGKVPRNLFRFLKPRALEP